MENISSGIVSAISKDSNQKMSLVCFNLQNKFGASASRKKTRKGQFDIMMCEEPVGQFVGQTNDLSTPDTLLFQIPQVIQKGISTFQM